LNFFFQSFELEFEGGGRREERGDGDETHATLDCD